MKHFPTDYSPEERLPREEIIKLNSELKSHPLIPVLLNSTPDIIMILNRYRQIVTANENFLDVLKVESETEILGKRPGEAMSCIHCKNKSCGTTKFCKYCGAINAIFNSQKFKCRDIQECNLTVRTSSGLQGFNFLVTATPFDFNKENFVIFSIRNISEQKFHHAIERIFFHDVLNLAGTIKDFMELSPEIYHTGLKEFHTEGLRISRQLISEIETHRDLLAAEQGQLEAKIEEIYVPDFLSLLVTLYKNHKVCEGKFIAHFIKGDISYICSDKILLSRILGNLIKNALESSKSGETVTVVYKNDTDGIRFLVHNKGFMTEDVQLQLFNRSFSTKGEKGRGFGTYTVKLLLERYLNGHVEFNSTKKNGTTFTVSL
ncbi:MAG: HAMP domain-containing sensor histidine kinase [Candidatus Eremiobacterota bacterium]